MNNEPLVSVVIPTFNRAHYLREAIESALAQTFSNREIIVVDDGSTDGTSELARQFTGRIHYVRKSNEGVSWARNTGLKQAKGKLIAFLDDDDRWLPTKLERQVRAFHNRPEVGVVHCKARAFDDRGNNWEHPFIGETVDLHIILRHWFPPLQASVFRRSLFDEIGEFDVTMHGEEDWDIFLRAATRCQFLSVPEVLLELRSHDSNMSKNILQSSVLALRVLEKNSRHHHDCAECRARVRETRAWLHKRISDAHRALAKKAISEKKYGNALAHAFKTLAAKAH